MDCLQGFAWDWGLLSPALSWAIASGKTLHAITDAFFAGRLNPSRLEQLLFEHGQLPGCGSYACPNVAGFSRNYSSNGGLPTGWTACELCGTLFCCRDCRDEARRLGHEELCALLCCGCSPRRPSGGQNYGS